MIVEYRVLHTPEELEDAVDLEILVWGLEPRWAVPSNVMRAVAHGAGGGVVIGAYHDTKLVGMSFGMPARRDNQWVLWSHMTGVDPQYQNHGIGFGLKQAQRDWALSYGYKVIAWTFDPLQRGNANFNLRHLGAIATFYHENLYGVMNDDINRGMPSDRLEATWILDDERVKARAAGQTLPDDSAIPYDQSYFLLRSEANGPVVVEAQDVRASHYFIEIPYNIGQIKQTNHALALAWQLAVRRVMQDLFARRYVAVDFTVTDSRCWYVLRRFSAL